MYKRQILKRSPKILKAAQDSNTLADIDDTRGNTATRASALIYDIDHLEYIEVRKPSGELVCMFKFDLKWKCDPIDSPCRVGSCTNGACSVVSAFTYDQTNLEPVLEKCSNLQDTIQMETTPLYSWKRVRNFRVQGDDAYADDYTNCNLVTNPLQCLYGGGNLEGAKLRKERDSSGAIIKLSLIHI